MRVELYATDTAASFVGAFDIPPFITPPGVMVWGRRTFVAFGEVVHMHDCAHATTAPPKPCNCGGVYGYREVLAYALLDMQAVIDTPTARYQPISRKP